MRLNYVLITAIALAGCASEPAKQAAEPRSAPAAPAARPVAPAVAKDPVAKVDPEASDDQGFVAPAGYQKKTKGSTTVYCRSDTPVGTRFATQYCYTQAELKRMEESRANVRQEVDRARRTCTGSGCGGG
jgi:hypothetical protein